MSNQEVHLTFPDGQKRDYPFGITGLDVALSISEGLARNAFSYTLNGEIRDLNRSVTEDGSFTINTWDTEDGQYTFWHSSAHLLAEAVQSLYPSAKFAIGPPIENGFYYDIDFGEVEFSQQDLARVEEKMLELARNKSDFVRSEVSAEEASEFYRSRSNEYKEELIRDLHDQTITFYTQGEFTDLCRGPHIPNTGVIKAVKLLSIAGAYWRGDVTRKQLTRIYGITFPKQKQLKEYLHQLEEAKKRDHKKLGRELGIYLIDAMVGPGLPLWLPNGTIIRRTLEDFLRSEQKKTGLSGGYHTPHWESSALQNLRSLPVLQIFSIRSDRRRG